MLMPRKITGIAIKMLVALTVAMSMPIVVFERAIHL